MTSRDVWDLQSDLVRRLAKEGASTNRVVTGSVRVPGGSLFFSADFARRLDGSKAKAPYLVEWLGPWDTSGRILLDQGLDPVWGSLADAA